MSAHYKHGLLIATSSILFALCFLCPYKLTFAQDIPEGYFSLLINQLKDPNREVRAKAAVTFINLRESATPAVPLLIEAMKDPNPEGRAAVVSVIGNMGPRAHDAVPAVLEALKDPSKSVRRTAAFAIGNIGQGSDAVISAEIELLRDPDDDIRIAGLQGTMRLKSDRLIPSLVEALRDPNDKIRSAAGMALMGKGKEASATIVPLLDNLRDQNQSVRLSAATVLPEVGVGSSAVLTALIQALSDPDVNVRDTVASRLAAVRVDPRMTASALINALQDSSPRVRKSALFALSALGSEANIVAPVLIPLLKDQDIEIQRSAITALGRMELKGMGSDSKLVIDALIEAMSEPDTEKKWLIAQSLGQIGAASKDAIPLLIQALGDDKDFSLRQTSAQSLGKIAMGLYDEKDTQAIPLLRSAFDALDRSSDPDVRRESTNVKRALDYLESLKGGKIHWIKTHLVLTSVSTAYAFLFLLWLSLLWIRPEWLLQVNESLSTYTDIRLPTMLGGFTIPPRYLFLVGFLHYNSRVLDGWVEKNISKAREAFSKLRSVDERQFYVPVPVILSGRSYAEVRSTELNDVFRKNLACLLIHGEGGAGKTSLACLLAKWAMSESSENRLCRQHLMIPILIEPGTEITVDNFEKTLSERLRNLLDLEDHPPIDLLRSLLKRRRVLVIVDGFSERTPQSKSNILNGISGLPINAIIITSRTDEGIDDKLPIATLEPIRIEGNRLSTFLEAYLIHRDKRNLFEDEEFFSACRQLSLIVKEGNITVLFAKMYADLIIASKQGITDYNLPKNIPELMLSYVHNLSRGFAANHPDNVTVRTTIQIIAWECLKQTYQPKPAEVSDVWAALGGRKTAQPLVKYLEKKLRIIETVGIEKDRIRFTLDPISEYFAALFLVNKYGAKADLWKQFLANARIREDAPGSINEFLKAVRDCCLAVGSDAGTPQFVPEEIADIIGRPLTPTSRQPSKQAGVFYGRETNSE